MSIDPRRTQPFCTAECYRQCRCSRWPDYENRFGWPVRPETETYIDEVLALGPIAYWPLDETAGAVAHCEVNPAQNGTAVGVTWASDNTGPFGTPAPYFDGANDYVDIFSAALTAAIDVNTGSLMIWLRRENPPGWNAGDSDGIVRLQFVNSSNVITIYKLNTALEWRYQQGASIATVNTVQGAADDAWMCAVMTWEDIVTRDLHAYKDGVEDAGSPANPTTSPVGAFSMAVIGALSLVPANVWQGWVAHVAIADRVWSQSEITALANP